MSRTILVTGANRGLGFGIIESLCKHNPLNLQIILSSRSQEKGQQAVEKLKKDYPSSNIQYFQLEIGNQQQTEYVKNILQNKDINASDLFQLTEEFVQCSENDPQSHKFKIQQPQYFSKALLNAWVRWIGVQQLLPKQNMFLICPGWCRTDMGGPKAPKSIQQGISYPLEIINTFQFERSERNCQLYSYGKLCGY